MKRGVYKKKILQLLQSGKLYTLAELHQKIPEADFSTVYRNIEQLQEEKMVQAVTVDKNTTKYELKMQNHGHFICDKCTRVECISMPDKFLQDKKVSDLVVHGNCSNCK